MSDRDRAQLINESDEDEISYQYQNTAPPKRSNLCCCQVYIFTLTFFSYATLHITREGWAFVKNHIVKTDKDRPDKFGFTSTQLGTIDMVYLLFYSFGIYVSGILGDKFSIRWMTGIGYLLICGVCLLVRWQYGSPCVYRLDMEVYGKYRTYGSIQLCSPLKVVLSQLDGLPWLLSWEIGSRKRGEGSCLQVEGWGYGLCVQGFWGVNRNFGNILGVGVWTLAHSYLGMTWQASWNIMGYLVGGFGIWQLLFLFDRPEKVGLEIKEDQPEQDLAEKRKPKYSTIEEREQAEFDRKLSMTATPKSIQDERQQEGLIGQVSYNIQDGEEERKSVSSISDTTSEYSESESEAEDNETSIGFWKAWTLPGVIPLSICYFGLKFANYGLMLWLPTYCKVELHLDEESTELIATLYEVGVIFGSIILGFASDLTCGKRGPVSFFGILIASGVHLLLILFKEDDILYLYISMVIIGFFVGGIGNIISSTAVADIAKNPQVKGKAMSTVTGIIDGTGSIGAAVGLYLIGVVSQHSWDLVFVIISIMVLIAAISLIKILISDIKDIKYERKLRRQARREKREQRRLQRQLSLDKRKRAKMDDDDDE